MTLNHGLYANNIITFIIIAIAVFILIKLMARAQQMAMKPAVTAATTKEYPQCYSSININAKRCPNCTSNI